MNSSTRGGSKGPLHDHGPRAARRPCCTKRTWLPIIEQGVPVRLFDNKRVLVLTPDATRTCPLPMMVRAIRRTIGERCARLDFMVALGTHTPLSAGGHPGALRHHRPRRDFPRSSFFNHDWDRPDTFRRIGVLARRGGRSASPAGC
ncbi:MAG: nickel-dependent lactate racemase [Desulfobacterales bacterium]|nr:nickel-dependent lactate racemase [Desulfobacterales bacterium]